MKKDSTAYYNNYQKLLDESSILTIINNSSVSILIVKNDQIQFVNSAFTQLTGFTLENISQKPFSELVKLIHIDDQSNFLKLFNEVLCGTIKSSNGSYQIHTLQKELKTIKVIFSKIILDEKDVILLECQDITELVKNIKSISEQERKIETIFNSAPISMMILDENTRIVAANDILKLIFNVTDDDIISAQPGDGLNCIISYNNSEGCGNTPACKNCLMRLTVTDVLKNTKSIKDREINANFIINDQMVNVWVELSAEQFLIEDRPHVFIALKDITDRKIIERKLVESEKKYRTVANYTHDWEYWIDENKNFQYISPSIEELTGYSIKDFISKEITLSKIVVDEYKSLIEQHMNSDLEKLDDVCDLDVKIKTKDGKEKWINHICQAVYDEDGRFLGRRGSNRDITRMKSAEEENIKREKRFSLELEKKVKERTNELHEFNNLLVTLIDTIPYPIFVKDKKGNYTIVNKTFLEYYEISHKEIIGSSVEKIAPLQVVDKTNSIDNQLLQNPGVVAYESFHITKSGDRRDILINKSTFGVDKVKPEGIAGIVIDITEQKKFEIETQQALKYQEELNEMKTNFISMVSHEFRTPLTSILASSDLIEMYGKTWPEEKYNRNIEILQDSVNDLVKLLDDVLTLSRTDSGKIKFEPTSLNLNELSSQLIDKVMESSKRSHDIILDIDPNLPKVSADPKLLRYILTQLLTNAIKFSETGSIIKLKVMITVDTILFELKDEGRGISESELSYIFDPFFRSPDVTSISGSGLGLAIVKKFVELHNGNISVQSEFGKGTKFTISLSRN